MKIYTYATHYTGGLGDLESKGVQILGIGNKWNGFMDKIRAYLDVCLTSSDNDILVFIDGFDTKIVRTLEDMRKRFLETNSRVLFSADARFARAYSRHIFLPQDESNDWNRSVINSGLGMGFCKDLRMLFELMLREISLKGVDDDQVILNRLYYTGRLPFNLCIDYNERVFKNTHKGDISLHDACIIQFPGTISTSRARRAVDEYLRVGDPIKSFLKHVISIIGSRLELPFEPLPLNEQINEVCLAIEISSKDYIAHRRLITQQLLYAGRRFGTGGEVSSNK